MNILPFVVILLMIFGLFSHSFLKTHQSSEIRSQSYLGYAKADRDLYNALEKDAYNSIKIKYVNAGNKSSKKEQTDTLSNRVDPRIKFYLNEKAKLNLSPLFYEDQKVPTPLFAICVKLFETLYQEAPFAKDVKFDHLLKSMIAAYKEKEDLTLLDLFPEDSSYEEIYYKMLKGNRSYNISQKKGYPPLSDFVTLGSAKQKPIAFASASYPLLEAAFGIALTQRVQKAEKKKRESGKKRVTLTKDELTLLIQGSEIIELCNFTSPKQELEVIVGQDKVSDIKVFKVKKISSSSPTN